MTRAERNSGHHRRKFRPPGGTDNRKLLRIRQERVTRAEQCRFPRPCPCPDCTPEITDDGRRCMDCGGEGGGGTMDPDVWIECGSCKGTGTR